MTYSSGNLILSTDYNGFVSTTVGANVNATWNSTYGQTALSTVSNVVSISATQWSTLNATISSMATHQGTTITSRTNPTAGSLITILSNLNTDITNCYANRYNAASVGSQFTSWTGTASANSGAGSGSAAWTITYTDTITFASAAAANAFFGAGGVVKTQFSKTSTGTVADTEWNSFIGTVCASGVYLTGDAASKTIAGQAYTGTTKLGGSGVPSILTTGTGFYNLTTTPTTIYKQFDTGAAYSSNFVSITAAVDVTGAILTLTTVWYDNGDSNPGSTAQITGGTGTTGISFGAAPATVVTYVPPETTNLTNTWGAPTVASTVSVA